MSLDDLFPDLPENVQPSPAGSVHAEKVLHNVRYIRYGLTGSRSYGFGEINANTDWDYIVEVDEIDSDLLMYLDEQGFRNCGTRGSSNGYGLEGSAWYICRHPRTNVNLIITTSEEQYDVWLRCEEVTRVLKLPKPQRQFLFELMLNRVNKEGTVERLRAAILAEDQRYQNQLDN